MPCTSLLTRSAHRYFEVQLYTAQCIIELSQLPVMPMFPIICRLFATLSVSLALSLPAYAVETLRVLAWPGYADNDLVKNFEKRFDVHIEVSFVSSDDMLREKISANQGGDFDVFAANTADCLLYTSDAADDLTR